MTRRLVLPAALILLGLTTPAQAFHHTCFPCLHHHHGTSWSSGQSSGVVSSGGQSFGVPMITTGQSFGVPMITTGQSFGVPMITWSNQTTSGTADAVSSQNTIVSLLQALAQRGCQVVNPGGGTTTDVSGLTTSVTAMKADIAAIRTQQATMLAELQAIRKGLKFPDPPAPAPKPTPTPSGGGGTPTKIPSMMAPRKAPELDRDTVELATLRQRAADLQAASARRMAEASAVTQGPQMPIPSTMAPQKAPELDRDTVELATLRKRAADLQAASARRMAEASAVASSRR